MTQTETRGLHSPHPVDAAAGGFAAGAFSDLSPGVTMEPGARAIRPASAGAAETREALGSSGARPSPVSRMQPLDYWEGVYGRYPIPDEFHALMAGKVPAVRHLMLRELGDFYSWVYKQEAREAAKFAGMRRRQQHKKAKVSDAPLAS